VKRQKKQPKRRSTNHAWPTWPWFVWRTCVGCGQEFRREWGWRRRIGTFGMQHYFGYVCGDCADSPEAAESCCAPRC